jgi:hypothetical protein
MKLTKEAYLRINYALAGTAFMQAVHAYGEHNLSSFLLNAGFVVFDICVGEYLYRSTNA